MGKISQRSGSTSQLAHGVKEAESDSKPGDFHISRTLTLTLGFMLIYVSLRLLQLFLTNVPGQGRS